MKKIFFRNDAEFNQFVEKAHDLGHSKTFHKKDEIIKIFNVRGHMSSGFFNTFVSRIIKNSLKLKKYDIPLIKITFERIRFKLYLTIFSKIKYKYFKKTLGATALLVILLWLI
jgi:peptide subunit release factor 1 (eRF1)